MKDKQDIFNIFEEFEEEIINTEILEELDIEENIGDTEFKLNDSLNETKKVELENIMIEPDTAINDNIMIEPDTTINDNIMIEPEEDSKIVLEQGKIYNELSEVSNLDISKTVRVSLDEELFKKIDGYGQVNIVALGIGGCGVNTIGRMFNENAESIKLIALDTSKQALEVNAADVKILLGESLFGGHGSGGQFDKLHQMFQNEKEMIKNLLTDVDMLFLTGGIGRGTGSVGLMEIGKIAQEMGVLTIGFAALSQRSEVDEEILKKYYNMFLENVDSNIVVENDRVFEVAKNIPINKAVKIADKLLVDGIQGISELITSPGKINLDYADIRTAFKDKGACVMGVGYGSGENAVVDAIEEAINSQIINFESVRNAKVIIFNITCAKNTITIDQATRGTDLIYSYNYEENIEHLLFGYSYNDKLGDKVKVTFVATGTTPNEINYKVEGEDNSFKPNDFTMSDGSELIIPDKDEATKELAIPDFLSKR